MFSGFLLSADLFLLASVSGRVVKVQARALQSGEG